MHPMGAISYLKYCIVAIAAVVCLAVGASAENISGRSGNEVGDFSEAPAGYRIQKTAASVSRSSMSIDLNSGPRRTIGDAADGLIKPHDSRQSSKIGLSPDDVRHYKATQLFNLALRKQGNNDLTGAIADYLAAIKIDDKEPAVHWYLGTAYEAAGKATEAKQEF